jgi:hypothetical protein
MSHKSKWMFAVSVSVLAGFVLIALPAVGQKDVLVTNTPAQPVPTAPQGTTNVAGTVNVGNTPNVNVTNTPNVNVANTPSVSIAGTPTVNLAAGGSVSVTNPLDGQSNPSPLAIMEGFQIYEDTCSTLFGGSNSAKCSFHALPAGKRLVIQEFDSDVLVEPGTKPANILLNALSVDHYFPATLMGNFNGDQFATHQATHIYSSLGATPFCFTTLSNFSNGSFICNISGFLLDQ